MPKFKASNGTFYNLNELEKLNGVEGIASGTGVSAIQGVGLPQVAVLPISALNVVMTDATTAGSHGAQKIFTFPEGNVMVLGAVTDLTIARVGTGLTATSAVVSSLGSVTVGTDNATLTSTEADIVPSTASTLAAGAGVTKGASTTAAVLNGTTTPAAVFLNFATPDAGSTATDALTVNGTVTISYLVLGDN
jgi:hypothetical protein